MLGNKAKEMKKQGLRMNFDLMRHKLLSEETSFHGQLFGTHKLRDRQALCWVTHGECDPRCNCICPCSAGNLSAVDPHGEFRVAIPGGKGCIESANCSFDCPAPSTLLRALSASRPNQRGMGSPVDQPGTAPCTRPSDSPAPA